MSSAGEGATSGGGGVIPSGPAAAGAEPPTARLAPERRLWSWAWTVPLGALLLAAVLFAQAMAERGPIIAIRFENGDGIRPGDPVSYRGVQVGEVRSVELGEGLGHVAVVAELRPGARGLAVEGTRFWIVRPEVSATRVTGLETLLGPRYLEVAPGPADAPPARAFQGLARAPVTARPGPAAGELEVIVQAPRRGSLSEGSPVYYREVRVGHVRGVRLAPDARTVDVAILIEPAYANLVRDNSRFWNASGIGLDYGLVRGLTVQTGTLEALIAGGIGFATPTRPGDPVENGHRFALAERPENGWLEWSPTLSIGERESIDRGRR